MLRGLTIALLAVGTVGALRLPVTLFQARGDGRADVVVSASVPSHVVRLAAPARPVRRAPVRQAQAPASVRRVAAPVTERTAPAKPRAKVVASVKPRVLRIIRAVPSAAPAAPTQVTAPAPQAALVVAPLVAATSVVAAAPAVEKPELRDDRHGNEKKSKHAKRRDASAAPAAVQLLGTVAPVETPALDEVSDSEDGDEGNGKHDEEHKHGHDKHS